MLPQSSTRNRHYSLIEVIVVLVLIGLIMGVVMPRVGFVPTTVKLSQVHGAFRSAFAGASTLASSSNHIVSVYVDLQKHELRMKMEAPAVEPLNVSSDSAEYGDEPTEPMSGIFESFQVFNLPPDMELNTVLVEPPEDPNVLRYLFYPNGEATGEDIPFTMGDIWIEVKVDRLTGRPLIKRDEDH